MNISTRRALNRALTATIVTLFLLSFILFEVWAIKGARSDRRIEDKHHIEQCLDLHGTVKLGASGRYAGCTYTGSNG